MNFKIAVLQSHSTPYDFERNVMAIVSYIQQSAQQHADILLLPECFITGYELPISNEEALSDESPYLQTICDAVKSYGVGVVATALTKGKDKPRNTAFVIDKDGKIIMKYSKVHTCDFADEACLESGNEFKVCDFHGIKLAL